VQSCTCITIFCHVTSWFEYRSGFQLFHRAYFDLKSSYPFAQYFVGSYLRVGTVHGWADLSNSKLSCRLCCEKKPFKFGLCANRNWIFQSVVLLWGALNQHVVKANASACLFISYRLSISLPLGDGYFLVIACMYSFVDQFDLNQEATEEWKWATFYFCVLWQSNFRWTVLISMHQEWCLLGRDRQTIQ
jgi:hypothetical protein